MNDATLPDAIRGEMQDAVVTEITRYEGPHRDLIELFRLAEDSESPLDRYIDVGTVWVAAIRTAPSWDTSRVDRDGGRVHEVVNTAVAMVMCCPSQGQASLLELYTATIKPWAAYATLKGCHGTVIRPGAAVRQSVGLRPAGPRAQRRAASWPEPGLIHRAQLPRGSPDARAADIAAEWGLDKSTVSRQIQQLTASELIIRSRERPGRRGQVLSLTSAGQQALDQAGTSIREHFFDQMQDWTDPDIATFAQCMTRFNKLQE